jgi:hypothetical protein
MNKGKSSLFTILLLVIIVITVVISLDLCGIITLPEKISLKTYLSNTVEVMGSESPQIYYPDYEATGIKNLNTNNNTNQNVNPEVTNSNEQLSQIIHENDGKEQGDFIWTENITDNSFYYNQLDTYGKTIYSRLYANLDNLKNGDYVIDFGITFNDLLQSSTGETTLTNAFQLAINAFLLDHPEVFYLDVTKMYMFTESTTTIKGTTFKISIGPDSGVSYLSEGFNSRSDVLIAEDNINTALYKIKSSLSGDIYNQIKQVHNYLIDTIDYDSESDSDLSHGIYGALVNKSAVCDGYTKAFKFILDNLGISCVEVCGIAQNSSGDTESHAWNDVLINGKWYAIDVTWDDPIIIGRSLKGNVIRHDNFCKKAYTFNSSHEANGRLSDAGMLFTLPNLSYSDYIVKN